MTVARPILLLGPMESHVGELLKQHAIGWQVDHDDIAGAEESIRRMASASPDELADKGRLGRKIIQQQLSMKSLCNQFCDVVEWD